MELGENEFFVFLGEDNIASFLVHFSSPFASTSFNKVAISTGIVSVAATAAIPPISIEGLIEPLPQTDRLCSKKLRMDKPQKGKQFLQLVL